MQRFKPFSFLYAVTAVAFITFGLGTGNFLILGLGLLTVIIALLSSSHWWRRTTIAFGKNNVIFGWTVIAILVALQIYGLISRSFGMSPILITFLVLMLIATADAMNILRGSSQGVR